MKKFTILVGKSACGKDATRRQILKTSSYKSIVSTTSRPPRENEQEGVDYYFISKDEFIELIEDGAFAEYRKYNAIDTNGESVVWYYGTRKNNKYSERSKYITILDLDGARSFIDYYGANNCRVCYIFCNDEERERRAKEGRGKDFKQEEWNRRLKDDNEKFSLKRFVEMFRDVETEIFDNINPNDYKQIAKDIIARD